MNKTEIKQIILEEIEAALEEMNMSPEMMAADSRPEEDDFAFDKMDGEMYDDAGDPMESINEDLRGLMAQGEKMAAFANKQSGYEGGVSSPVRGVLAAMAAAGAPDFDGDEDLKAYWTRQLTKAIKTQMGRKYMSGLDEMARTSNIFKLSQNASLKDVLQFMQRVNDVLKTYKSPGQKRPKKRFTPEEMKALATAMLKPEGFTSKDVIAATSYTSPAQANKFLAALEQKGLITITSVLKKSLVPDRDPNAPETRGRKAQSAEFDIADDPTGMDFSDFDNLDLSDPTALYEDSSLISNIKGLNLLGFTNVIPLEDDDVEVSYDDKKYIELFNKLEQLGFKYIGGDNPGYYISDGPNPLEASDYPKPSRYGDITHDDIEDVKNHLENYRIWDLITNPNFMREFYTRDTIELIKGGQLKENENHDLDGLKKAKPGTSVTVGKDKYVKKAENNMTVNQPTKHLWWQKNKEDKLVHSNELAKLIAKNKELKENNNMSNNLTNYIKKVINEAKNPLAAKLKEVEAQGRIAALESKLAAIQEMIEETNGRLTRIDEDNEFSEMMDKKAVKEVRKQLKELERAEAKLQKEYDKISGGRKKETVVDELKDNPVEGEEDEYDSEEDRLKDNPIEGVELEEDDLRFEGLNGVHDLKPMVTMNESLLRMQKLAGLITEGDIKKKLSLNEGDAKQMSDGTKFSMYSGTLFLQKGENTGAIIQYNSNTGDAIIQDDKSGDSIDVKVFPQEFHKKLGLNSEEDVQNKFRQLVGRETTDGNGIFKK